jgi:hypothetical protein
MNFREALADPRVRSVRLHVLGAAGRYFVDGDVVFKAAGAGYDLGDGESLDQDEIDALADQPCTLIDWRDPSRKVEPLELPRETDYERAVRVLGKAGADNRESWKPLPHDPACGCMVCHPPAPSAPSDADVERLARHLCDAETETGTPRMIPYWCDLNSDERACWLDVARAALALGCDPRRIP